MIRIRIEAVVLSIAISISLFISQIMVVDSESMASSTAQNIKTVNTEDAVVGKVYGTGQTSYKAYQEKYKTQPRPDLDIDVNINDFTCSAEYATIVDNIGDRREDCILTNDDGYIEWEIDIPESGLYNICLDYFPAKGKGSSIVRSLYIDGKIPFDEANSLIFQRVFTNGGDVTTDRQGNQLRPTQIEKPIWQSKDLCDALGYYNAPFSYYFSSGKHKLRLQSVKEPMIIGSIRLHQTKSALNYNEVQKYYLSQGYEKATVPTNIIQGEDAVLKSDAMIYALSDKSSVSTQPSSYDKLLLNTIGGIKWQTAKQWVTWEFAVEETGLYKIGIKARQNILQGQSAYRKIHIDGQTPYSELDAYEFPYSTSWEMYVPGGDINPDLIYLTKGLHTIKMEVNFGDTAELIQQISQSISNLNSIYRNFLMVIGSTPDPNRDYQFDLVLPDQLEELAKEAVKLDKIYDDYLKLNKIAGTQGKIIYNLLAQIKKMCKDPDIIARQFPDFALNISSLGTWLQIATTSPLEIDYIVIASPDLELPSAKAGAFQEIWFAIRQFLASFYMNYNDIGGDAEGKSSLKIWISTGRDQASALNQLIKNDFSSESDIIPNLQLVPAGTLLTATLAHKGPDVALTLSQTDIMNYAFRGAVVDISQFNDYNEIIKRFQPSAIVPLGFNGNGYALPETQSFAMMFYRSDILDQLNLKVPDTWDDVISMLPVLQKKNMNFGLQVPYSTLYLGAGYPAYLMFLYQSGGQVYTADGSTCLLDSKTAINAFTKWTNFYTQYALPREYDFNTRFRSGEIPIGIADYGTYNALSIFAPELNGIWKFGLVPGTRQPDGTIDRSIASVVNGSAIMSSAKDKDVAWEFIKWWTSADLQEKYASEIESIMGPAGRYQTANIEALYKIPWSTQDFNTLMEQWKLTKAIPEVPGSYMTPRYVDFGFKQVVVSTEVGIIKRPGQIIIKESDLVNRELQTKRTELGFND